MSLAPDHNLRNDFLPNVVQHISQYLYFIVKGSLVKGSLPMSCKIYSNQRTIQGVPKNLLYSGEHYIVVSLFNFVFFRVCDKTRNKCCKDYSNLQLG